MLGSAGQGSRSSSMDVPPSGGASFSACRRVHQGVHRDVSRQCGTRCPFDAAWQAYGQTRHRKDDTDKAKVTLEGWAEMSI